MKSSCFLGKVLVALGICMTMLSFDAFINESEGACMYCVEASCAGQQGPNCSAGVCNSGCFCYGNCACKVKSIDTMKCGCQE